MFECYNTPMNKVMKILTYIFFAAVIVPSFCNLIIAYNDNVRKGNMPVRDLIAQVPKYSYQPVRDFYVEQYRKFIPKSE